MINKTEQAIYRLGNLDALQQKISYQMSTGKKLQQGSDDSLLYSREVFVDDKIRIYEGLKTQIERTNTQNNVADGSMSEIKKLLEYTKAELIKANTATTSENGMRAIATNLEGMRENLLDLANTQVGGEYIFAGSDASVKPFKEDSNGEVTYVGNNVLRKVAVEEGSYRERGLTGLDMMMYPSSTAYKGETLSFKENDRIIDEDGNEWKLNASKDTLEQYDLEGNKTGETIINVLNDGSIPATYTATAPSTDGTKLEAKTNILNVLNDVIKSLKQVDNTGNPISMAEAREGVSKGLGNLEKAFDSANIAHAELGGRNKVFEVSLEKVSARLTHYNILSQELGAADLSKVAMEAKALELTYTALYSTINRTNQLSLVNFLK